MKSRLRLPRPTLIDRYILREIVPFALLGLVLFTFVLLLPQIAEMMGFLVSRGADPWTVIKVFIYFTPYVLMLTIPMSVLLGVLLAFGRMGSESEIIALRAGGVSPLRLLRPAVVVGLVGTLVTFYITAIVYPRASQAYRDLTTSLVAIQARTAVRAGVFTDDLLPSGALVLYASNVLSSSGEWQDLLLRDTRDPQRPRLILARRGRLIVNRDAGEARLDLEHGALYSLDTLRPELWEEHRFAYRQLQLPFRDLFPPRVELSKGPGGQTLPELNVSIRQEEQRPSGGSRLSVLYVERHKRYAFATACLVFALFGVGLSLGQKKEARSAAFGLSIGAIFIYYVVIRFGEQLGVAGAISPALAMWAANGLFILLAAALMVLNQRGAAFDPLDAAHYTAWLPAIRRLRQAPPPRPPQERDGRLGESSAGVSRRFRLWTLLDAYIAYAYVGHLLLTTTAFWSLTLLIELMDLVDDLQQHSLPWSVLFRYLTFQAPAHLILVLPVAFLVATLTTLGLLARRNEITAMKAGGISVYRVALPVMATALSGAVLLFALGEFIVPFTNRVAQRQKAIIKGRPLQSGGYLPDRMVLGGRGRFYSLTSSSRATPDALHALWAYDVDPEKWRLQECLFAGYARWNRAGGFYDLERGWRRVLEPRPSFRAFESTRTREIEPPEYFRQEAGSSATMRFDELRVRIRALAALGLDVVRLRVDLHQKLALPAVAVVMALLGIPFSFVVGRRGALYGIGLAILLAIVYYSCFEVFRGLGNNALLPPALALWAPNVLFAGAALYLLLGLDT